MNKAMPLKQRGVTFGGMVFGAFLLILVSIFLLKVIPVYMQDEQIKNIFNAISQNPDLQRATPGEIRSSFEKRASIDGVKTIRGEDIDISSDNGRLILSANYSVKIPLSGNVSLLMEFNPTSAQ
ncbi:MAG: DUF4845 domain-containing protein [Gallionella sp.]|nr:DUF4845 domain-containing protein [Gallionella sp.]